MKTKSYTKNLGNLLIILSVIILTFIYLPILKIYFFSPKEILIPTNTLAIVIPKIHASSPIIPNVNAWNKTEYQSKLKQGIAHAKGTAIPGEKGISLLFAHSSDLPWNITRVNTAFFRLNELKKNDRFYIIKNGKRIEYKVVMVKTVWLNETEFLNDKKNDFLILQTCTPIGTDLKRLLVFSKRT